eukprot:scaffold625151_cov45-Prasinocladus_malaysianus.AAC.1
MGAAPQMQPPPQLMLRMGQIPMQPGQVAMQTLPQALCMPAGVSMPLQALQGQPAGMPLQLQMTTAPQMNGLKMVTVSTAASGVPAAMQMPSLQMTPQQAT